MNIKRIFALFLSLNLATIMGGCKIFREDDGNNEADIHPNVNLTSYKDIPGVTAEEIDAIESLKEERDNLIYAHILETEAFELPNGEYGGFVYEFCKLLSELFGIEFKGQCYDEWGDLLTNFKNRNVDFMSIFSAFSLKATEGCYITTPIADCSIGVFTLESFEDFDKESDIEGLNIGTLTDTIAEHLITDIYPVTFNTVFVDSCEEAAEMLIGGEIDAFIAAETVEPNFKDYKEIEMKAMFPLAYTPTSVLAIDPLIEPIISVINKYLKAGGIDKLAELYEKGNLDYTKTSLQSTFTDEEKKYLSQMFSQKKRVKTAVERDNYPICFYDEDKNEFQGIAIDILREINKLTDLEFEVMTSENESREMILEKIRLGEISMGTQMVRGESLIGDYIFSKTPYSYSRYALVSKISRPNYSSSQIAHLKVGVTENPFHEVMYNKWFPGFDNLVKFDGLDIGIRALDNNEIDLLMTDESVLLTQTSYLGKSGYKANVSFNSPIGRSFVFNKDEDLLCSIINKTQHFVNTAMIDERWTNRVFDYERKLVGERFRFIIIFVTVLSVMLFVVSLLLFNILKKNKEKIMAEKQALRDTHFKRSLLSNIKHRVKTPLNAIIEDAKNARVLILDDKASPEIDHIISTSDKLLGTLNDMLEISKMESGEFELINKPFSPIDAYGEVLESARQECLLKNIRLKNNIQGLEGITLIGDRVKINQVLTNLLDNAIKFTPNGGNVELSIRELERKTNTIRIEFSIRDNGEGMPREELKKLSSSSSSSQYSGTGLGLTISQGFVRAMGSKIIAESSPRTGSKLSFELLLPFSDSFSEK